VEPVVKEKYEGLALEGVPGSGIEYLMEMLGPHMFKRGWSLSAEALPLSIDRLLKAAARNALLRPRDAISASALRRLFDAPTRRVVFTQHYLTLIACRSSISESVRVYKRRIENSKLLHVLLMPSLGRAIGNVPTNGNGKTFSTFEAANIYGLYKRVLAAGATNVHVINPGRRTALSLTMEIIRLLGYRSLLAKKPPSLKKQPLF